MMDSQMACPLAQSARWEWKMVKSLKRERKRERRQVRHPMQTSPKKKLSLNLTTLEIERQSHAGKG